MRKLGLMASFAFAAALLSQPALADKRVALVIGNSAYQNVIKLANPANDADAMTETLKAANFDIVDGRRDLKATEMRRALRDFADKARTADVAVIYFAGHGIEVDGTNYLIPTDALLERDTDVYDEAFSLERILSAVEPAKKLRLVILDACRDNPFQKSMKRTTASRAIPRGLAKVEPASPNTLIAYSAKAGSTALDGDSKNSPFTTALVRHIATPGLDLRKAFGFVRDEVMKETGNRQEPYVYGSLGGDDVALVPVATPAANTQAEARRDYELAMQVGTSEGWNAFLGQHPTGFYANLAKAQLSKIAAGNAHVTASEKARLAVEEKARLAAEGAKKIEQDRAATEAQAAEDARIAAEKRKVAEEERAATAERSRAAAEAKSDAAKPAPTSTAPRVAALSPAATDAPKAAPSTDLPRQVQVELQRVGCLQGSVQDNWTSTSGKSLERFNRYASTRFDSKAASADALDAIRAKSSRVCPLTCAHGSRADGDKCVRIVCRSGSFLNDDNECEKKRSRNEARRNVPRRERIEAEDMDRPRTQARAPRAAQPSGQIVCDAAGCRPVRPGCRLVEKDMRIGLTNVEACN